MREQKRLASQDPRAGLWEPTPLLPAEGLSLGGEPEGSAGIPPTASSPSTARSSYHYAHSSQKTWALARRSPAHRHPAGRVLAAPGPAPRAICSGFPSRSVPELSRVTTLVLTHGFTLTCTLALAHTSVSVFLHSTGSLLILTHVHSHDQSHTHTDTLFHVHTPDPHMLTFTDICSGLKRHSFFLHPHSS